MKKYVLLLLVSMLLLLGSCEKNIQSISSETDAAPVGQNVLLKGFGIEIDEASGRFTLYQNGQPVGLGKLGSPAEVMGDISSTVTLDDIKYTAEGCGTPSDLIREISLDFTNKSDSPTYAYIVPQNFSGFNTDGVSGYVDTDVAPGEEFHVVIQVKLSTCAAFSVYFDLYDNF